MERLEIIKARDFADKFNELTSFIYDNFTVLCKWALIFVVPASIVMTALMMYLPDVTSINILKTSLCIMIVSVLSVVLNTMAMHYYEDGIELKSLHVRDYAAELLKKIGLGIVASLVFNVIASCIAIAINGMIDDNKFITQWSFLFYSLIIVFFLMPVFYSLNAVVIEDKNGNEAIKRAVKLMFYHPFMAILFLFTMTLIGLILPEIASIPYYVIEHVHDIFSQKSGFLFTTESMPIWEFVSMTLVCFCFTLTLLSMGVGMMFEYGNAVEKADNVSFMKKFNNFENL